MVLICPVNSQGITETPDSQEEIFKFRIKQLSEFIDIFNNKVDYESRGIDTHGIVPGRESLIASLFDQNDPRFDPESKEYSKEYSALVKSFIKEVVNEGLTLSKGSEDIYARARTEGIFESKKVEFYIILQQEQVGADMLKWVVRDVEADFLEIFIEDTVNLRFLPPSSDELDFMELRRALNDLDYLNQYAYRGYKPDQLTLFFFLLQEKKIKIEAILDVTYRLLEINGWKIDVAEFNRNSKNSGWLIHNLDKI